MDINNCITALISSVNASAAVVSPGSRNAPIIYALDQRYFQVYSIVDERSAGFVALGIAKALNQPVILSCTSGTAALNYYPAIAEAFYARIPLIVLTADRPSDAIDQWDGQAIRQSKVFSNHVCKEFNTPEDYSNEKPFLSVAREINAYWEKNVPGPIHVNIPIKEPFYASLTPLKRVKSTSNFSNHRQRVSIAELEKYLKADFSDKRILVFNGMASGEQLEVVAEGLEGQTVVLSDANASQIKGMSHWDSMLYNSMSLGFEGLELLKPDVLITTGTTTVSKGLKLFLRKYQPTAHYHISHYDHVGKMFNTHPLVIHPDNCIKVDDQRLDEMTVSTPFKNLWGTLDTKVAELTNAIDWEAWNEFAAVRKCLRELDAKSELHVSNSMPVRYVNFCIDILQDRQLKVFGNRGTSGIDGCTSTAVGSALATEKQHYLLTGDIAFLYDVNALFNSHLPGNLKIVVLNNGGGGIFELISGPEKMGASRRFQTTDQHVNLKALCDAYGVGHLYAKNHRQLKRAIHKMQRSDECTVLEVVTNRESNKSFFEAWKATITSINS